MNRGPGAHFHSAEKSSSPLIVEPVWKVCKSGLKSRKADRM